MQTTRPCFLKDGERPGTLLRLVAGVAVTIPLLGLQDGCVSPLYSPESLWAVAEEREQARDKSLRDDHLIVPGVRVGALVLGMTDEEVFRVIGVPDRGYSYGYFYDDKGLTVGIKDDRLVLITAKISQYSTPEGVKVGDGILRLTDALGKPAKVVEDQTCSNCDNYELFWKNRPGFKIFRKEDEVHSITVYVPGIEVGGNRHLE
jgi:hypothetical protein